MGYGGSDKDGRGFLTDSAAALFIQQVQGPFHQSRVRFPRIPVKIAFLQIIVFHQPGFKLEQVFAVSLRIRFLRDYQGLFQSEEQQHDGYQAEEGQKDKEDQHHVPQSGTGSRSHLDQLDHLIDHDDDEGNQQDRCDGDQQALIGFFCALFLFHDLLLASEMKISTMYSSGFLMPHYTTFQWIFQSFGPKGT